MTATDLATQPPPSGPRTPSSHRTGRWIEHWEPEDEAFWDGGGSKVARRNLVWSILAEHVGFSVWMLWSVSAVYLAAAGFDFTVDQLFWLAAVPSLVGATMRFPYTFAVARFGGRNWTVVSALLLLVPCTLLVVCVGNPATPYWMFVLAAVTAGLGGGNFASSMANISYFYPDARKGWALGLNAAGGNIGVSTVQLVTPVVVGVSVGALRAHGLREVWSPPSGCFEDVLAHLRGTSLAGRRIVVQEHGRSLSVVANALRVQGADVRVVSVYRCAPGDDQAAMFRMVDLVAGREVDAVTFTSASAAEILMDVAVASGRRSEVLDAFREDVLATCVGPVTAAPFAMWGVPVVQPARSRLAAMVKTLEVELPSRRAGTELVVGGRRLLLHGDRVCLDGGEVALSQAPLAVLRALADRPGHVVSRRELMGHLPSGHAASEHAVEVAVARLRSAVGPRLVQTVVKRGYRLPV